MGDHELDEMIGTEDTAFPYPDIENPTAEQLGDAMAEAWSGTLDALCGTCHAVLSMGNWKDHVCAVVAPAVVPTRAQVEQAFIDGSVAGSPIDYNGNPVAPVGVPDGEARLAALSWYEDAHGEVVLLSDATDAVQNVRAEGRGAFDFAAWVAWWDENTPSTYDPNHLMGLMVMFEQMRDAIEDRQ